MDEERDAPVDEVEEADGSGGVDEVDLPDSLFDDELGEGSDVQGSEGDEVDGDTGDAEEAPRRNALPRRMESWRSRTASGAIVSAVAMGLQQVFEPERRKPAIMAEAPGDPYDDDDPVVVDYVADDAQGTTVILRPWLMQTSDGTEPSEGHDDEDADVADPGVVEKQ